jgi:outer membrane protein OmpA-like peptidoglycan-associated protein
LGEELQQAVKNSDLDALTQSADRIQTERFCPDDFRPKAGRVAANAMVRMAQEDVARGGTLMAQEGLLQASLSYSRTWVALAMLGDIRMEGKAYEEATTYFQEALTVINDEVETPRAPPNAVIESIFRKASESRMLAERYVAVPVNHRSGAAEGLALGYVRGWKVEKVPVPITFHTDSTQFTSKGVNAAQDLLSYLNQQASPRITIIGHTDERGDVSYNLTLSLRRAVSVANWLRQHGFGGEIDTRGRGESVSLELDDPSRYSRQEIWQLNRRVELLRD